MTIRDIYSKLGIPPNLQEHMLRVTSVALFIQNHWKGGGLDRDVLKTMLLLHDVGNTVKFDLDAHPEFLGEQEMKRVDYWKQKQQEVIRQYGADDHHATIGMLNELNINKDIQKRIYDMGYWNVEQVKNSNDWYLKVALYSDLRVGVFGILSLRQRLDDVHKRLEKYRNKPELIEFANELEIQIQENVDISLDQINDATTHNDSQLLETQIT